MWNVSTWNVNFTVICIRRQSGTTAPTHLALELSIGNDVIYILAMEKSDSKCSGSGVRLCGAKVRDDVRCKGLMLTP